MHKKVCTNEEESRKVGAIEGGADTNKNIRQASPSQAPKMPPKENRSARPIQGQNRKRRLVPGAKALPVEGMREAAQLARSYMRAIETHNQGNYLGGQMPDIGASPGLPYEHLLQFPGSTGTANSKLHPHDLSLISQLHTNGIVPSHLLNVDPGSMTVNKRPFLANAAEESRMKRLRKLVNLTNLETLGHQAPAVKYGGSHNNSPLLPTPPSGPLCFFDSRYDDPNFQYLHASPYSGDPPSPTPRSKASRLSKLRPEMRLDSSAFPSAVKLDAAADGCYDGKDNQMKRASLSQQHLSAKGSTDCLGNPILQFPNNNISFPQLDGIRHMTSFHPQNRSLFDNRSHMMPAFANGDHKSEMISDGAYLGPIGQEVPIGLPQFSSPELAAYIGHLASSRNLPQQHDGITHFGSGQHQELINRSNSRDPNSHPNNPSAGILPLPVRPELNGSKNNLNSLAYLPPDAGILPLPGRSEQSQMASLQRVPTAAQGFNGSQHSFGQPVQFQSLSNQGDLASLQQELSGQRSAAGIGHHTLFPSPQVQNHIHFMNQELSAQRIMGKHHHLLQPLAYPNDMATLQQELSAQQFNNAAAHHHVPLQGDFNDLQQELSAQRLQNSLLPNELASLQHELLLSRRLNAGHHPLLQSYPMQGNLALLQQDLAANGLNGGHNPLLQASPGQGELSALQQEFDFQRLNHPHPLMQMSLQQQLPVQNFGDGHRPLLKNVHT